jgi:DNA-binding transcriptional LysR family regulator
MKPLRYKELHPTLLRTFCACADRGSYSAAARHLGVSQPVVWQRVQALERHLQTRLFLRRGRQLCLTPRGRALRVLAGDFLARWDGLLAALRERQGLARTLVVAGSDVLFGQELAAHLVQFCQMHPTIPLSLRIRHNFEIEQLLAEGQVDLAILPHSALVPSSASIALQSLGERPWHLVTPRGHPLARRPVVRARDLVRYPWILSDAQQNYWSREVRMALARAGVADDLRIALCIDNSMLACRYVAMGLGITATPYYPADLEGNRLHARPLKRFFRPDHLMVWWRRGTGLSEDAQTFIQFLRQRLARPGRPHAAGA